MKCNLSIDLFDLIIKCRFIFWNFVDVENLDITLYTNLTYFLHGLIGVIIIDVLDVRTRTCVLIDLPLEIIQNVLGHSFTLIRFVQHNRIQYLLSSVVRKVQLKRKQRIHVLPLRHVIVYQIPEKFVQIGIFLVLIFFYDSFQLKGLNRPQKESINNPANTRKPFT